ncbi:MAG: KEOPS complex kinase/ATPase Bud32 [Candidatus Thermoplasmatota archaeon]|nr:KEOPS complex kinase/ATPase Bud32 [Candidatus Thermoplasmatota archaeon]
MTEENSIYQGAEAKIIKTMCLGYPVVEKRRLKKSYRIQEIDTRLIASRTKEEAKLMAAARKQGVCVPIIFDVDIQQGIITMEYIEGNRIKDIYNTLSKQKRLKLCRDIGESIGRLHMGDIIHGDITTSNMIVYEGRIHFIDFGLGEINHEVEAKGVDLHVLMEAMESTHSRFANEFKYVLEGYKRTYIKNPKEVEGKIQEIVQRGRYR